MRLRAGLALLTLLPLSALSVAADGDDTCRVLSGAETTATTDDVLACETTQWLGDCDSSAGGKVYEPNLHGTAVMLSPDAPTASFTEAAGCGTVDDPFLTGTVQDTPFSFDIKGYLETNPDTLTVELHDISASTMRSSRTTNLRVRVSIEGAYPLGSEENTSVDGTVSRSPLTMTIPVTAVASSTGVSDSLVFTLTRLSEVLPADLYAVGRGEELEVIVTIDPGTDGAHAWVWGATEVASNVTFNGEVRGSVVDSVRRRVVAR